MNFSVKSITNNLGYQQITSVSSAVGLTLPVKDPFTGIAVMPRLALIQCTGKDVRWRDDGTDPSSTVGMVLIVGDTLAYDGEMTKIKFIESSASAVLNISYYA